jgi:hypothetical protein
MMETEKKEEKKEIVVLDEGMDMDAVGGPGPEMVCCWAFYMPLRW